MIDLLVRGGLVVDGSGGPPFAGDVAVDAGRITSIGHLGAVEARTTLDADGCVVTPGFIDAHTHLDAQLCWDPDGSPSHLHGVTTVVTGCCGFGVAPAEPGTLDFLLRTFEAVEEIPYESSSSGVTQSWVGFDEYLDHLDGLELGVNVVALVPHSALRVFALGEDADRRAEPAEVDRMVGALGDAIRAGAAGFASTRGLNHADHRGRRIPSAVADDAELEALVAACSGRTWQMDLRTKQSVDAAEVRAEVEVYAQWAQRWGVRLTWTPLMSDNAEKIDVALAQAEHWARQGVRLAPQIGAQAVTTTLSLSERGVASRLWPHLAETGFFESSADTRRAALGDAATRAAMGVPGAIGSVRRPDPATWTVLQHGNRHVAGRRLGELAEELGVAPIDALCELVIDDPAATFTVAIANADQDAMVRLLANEHTLVGLGDAGAHLRSITNYTYPTTMLAALVRDQGALSLEHAVATMTSAPADLFGVADRGRLTAGLAADLNVIDLDALRLGPLERRHDLPAGAPRLYQPAEGYRYTVVGGRVSRVDGAVVARSGKVVRCRPGA
ncbi:MAG TPA: amidohydrolase family protein [Ilumatobacter sp.]|nr:amidohydrolase family protein [Ilumatobacter sp.]